jgi:hypothetical protein
MKNKMFNQYIKDSDNEDLIVDPKGFQVMMEWERPYMEESIKQLNPFGKVLEIGFGLGYTATKLCSFVNVTEYNVIECTPTVWDKFFKFKSEQLILRPELKVNLIKGRWEDVLQTIGIYDCIYFDDYILSQSNQVINDRFDDFLYKKVHEIMKILAFKVKIDLEKLYYQFGWPLYKIYGHAYVAFKEALK